jgi:hypothetical protein
MRKPKFSNNSQQNKGYSTYQQGSGYSYDNIPYNSFQGYYKNEDNPIGYSNSRPNPAYTSKNFSSKPNEKVGKKPGYFDKDDYGYDNKKNYDDFDDDEFDNDYYNKSYKGYDNFNSYAPKSSGFPKTKSNGPKNFRNNNNEETVYQTSNKGFSGNKKGNSGGLNKRKADSNKQNLNNSRKIHNTNEYFSNNMDKQNSKVQGPVRRQNKNQGTYQSQSDDSDFDQDFKDKHYNDRLGEEFSKMRMSENSMDEHIYGGSYKKGPQKKSSNSNLENMEVITTSNKRGQGHQYESLNQGEQGSTIYTSYPKNEAQELKRDNKKPPYFTNSNKPQSGTGGKKPNQQYNNLKKGTKDNYHDNYSQDKTLKTNKKPDNQVQNSKSKGFNPRSRKDDIEDMDFKNYSKNLHQQKKNQNKNKEKDFDSSYNNKKHNTKPYNKNKDKKKKKTSDNSSVSSNPFGENDQDAENEEDEEEEEEDEEEEETEERQENSMPQGQQILFNPYMNPQIRPPIHGLGFPQMQNPQLFPGFPQQFVSGMNDPRLRMQPPNLFQQQIPYNIMDPRFRMMPPNMQVNPMMMNQYPHMMVRPRMNNPPNMQETGNLQEQQNNFYKQMTQLHNMQMTQKSFPQHQSQKLDNQQNTNSVSNNELHLGSSNQEEKTPQPSHSSLNQQHQQGMQNLSMNQQILMGTGQQPFIGKGFPMMQGNPHMIGMPRYGIPGQQYPPQYMIGNNFPSQFQPPQMMNPNSKINDKFENSNSNDKNSKSSGNLKSDNNESNNVILGKIDDDDDESDCNYKDKDKREVSINPLLQEASEDNFKNLYPLSQGGLFHNNPNIKMNPEMQQHMPPQNYPQYLYPPQIGFNPMNNSKQEKADNEKNNDQSNNEEDANDSDENKAEPSDLEFHKQNLYPPFNQMYGKADLRPQFPYPQQPNLIQNKNQPNIGNPMQFYSNHQNFPGNKQLALNPQGSLLYQQQHGISREDELKQNSFPYQHSLGNPPQYSNKNFMEERDGIDSREKIEVNNNPNNINNINNFAYKLQSQEKLDVTAKEYIPKSKLLN